MLPRGDVIEADTGGDMAEGDHGGRRAWGAQLALIRTFSLSAGDVRVSWRWPHADEFVENKFEIREDSFEANRSLKRKGIPGIPGLVQALPV